MKQSNTEPLLSQFLHSKGRTLGLPIAGNFELTARCNFHCPMCYVHLSREDVQAAGRELTAQQWISIARQARDQGMVFALLTGGEPFVREDFFEIFHAMKELGLMVSINSNGSMLDGEIRRALLEDPPFRINISLYGGCAETYRNMCGQNVFDRVLENVRALKEAGVDVRLNLSITPYNRRDLADIYAIARELDVHVKAASYMYPPIRVNGSRFGVGDDRLSPEDAAAAAVEWDLLRFSPEEFSARAQNMRAMVSDEVASCPTESEEGVRCRAGRTSFWMTWDGKMLPCGMMPWPVAYPMETGFSAAWNQIREETARIKAPVGCTTCPKKEICAVCAAVRVTETGSFEKIPTYFCRYTQAQADQTWEAYLQKEGKCHGDKKGTD